MVFSDESTFELYNPPNPKNDINWSLDSSTVEYKTVPNFSPKVILMGAMSFSGLSDLHGVMQGFFIVTNTTVRTFSRIIFSKE